MKGACVGRRAEGEAAKSRGVGGEQWEIRQEEGGAWCGAPVTGAWTFSH